MRILEHTSLRIARIVDLRNIANHLIHQGTLVGIVSHLGLELKPLSIRGVHGNSVDCDSRTLNCVVPNVLNPLKFKSRVIRTRRAIRILDR